MKVQILTATENALDVISLCAGTCYGKDDVRLKRVDHCFKNEHLSVFENVSFTVRVEGISRACSHQLVRHRLASFCQESQRYVKYDFDNDDWYITPEVFCREKITELFFKLKMSECARSYEKAINSGIKPEDARYLLPEATKTNLTMTMNCRELFHFLDMRTDKAAQWEIRNLAEAIKLALCIHDDDWKYLIELWEERCKN